MIRSPKSAHRGGKELGISNEDDEIVGDTAYAANDCEDIYVQGQENMIYLCSISRLRGESNCQRGHERSKCSVHYCRTAETTVVLPSKRLLQEIQTTDV